MTKRSQVTRGRAAMSQAQVKMEASGTHGAHGVLRPRGRTFPFFGLPFPAPNPNVNPDLDLFRAAGSRIKIENMHD
jgi:hypothetical protein